MNKRLIIIDTITFVIGIILLILTRLSYVFIGDNFVVTLIIAVLTIMTAIISMMFSYRESANDLNYMNDILCILYFILLYAVYLLPVFNFVGQKGVNNSVCAAFEFLFGAKFLVYFSFILKSKNINAKYNIGKNALTGTNNYYKIFIVLGMIGFVGGIICVIINTVLPAIDMSMPYQMIVIQQMVS